MFGCRIDSDPVADLLRVDMIDGTAELPAAAVKIGVQSFRFALEFLTPLQLGEQGA